MEALNRKVGLSLGLALALAGGLGLQTLRSYQALLDGSARMAGTHLVLERFDQMLRHLATAQGGQRDFLLTGSQDFLESCQASLFEVDQDLREIRHQVQGTPFAGRLAVLDPLLVRQVQFFNESFSLRRQAGPAAAAALIQHQGSEASLQELYALASTLQQEESQGLAAQSAELQAQFQGLQRDLWMGAAAGLLLALVIAWFVSREMARRGRAEADLARRHGALQLVMDHMAEAVLLLGPQAELQIANPAAQRLFGAQLLATPLERWGGLTELWEGDERSPLAWERTPLGGLPGGDGGEAELFLRLKGRAEGRHLGLSVQLLRGPGGAPQGALAVFRDISSQRDLRSANQALQASVGALERQNGEFSRLSQLVEAMQAAQSMGELAEACCPLLGRFFAGLSGGVLLADAAHAALERFCAFGPARDLRERYELSDCWALRRGQPHLHDAQSANLACAHHGAQAPVESYCLPLMAQGDLLGLLHLSADQAGVLDEHRRQMAGLLAEQLGLALANLALRERLRSQSVVDPLTGLFNRRYMEESFRRQIGRGGPKGAGLGLVMVDVDHFKQFNDRFGHDAGDLVLRQIGQTLRMSVRPTDIVCRYGGEEMVLLLPGATAEQARVRAEACRAAVAALDLSIHGQALGHVTVSMGVAASVEERSGLDDLVREADRALYQAKHDGRNRVVMGQPQPA
jgi:diguanylate cyclase (GGDEF)-like protein